MRVLALTKYGDKAASARQRFALYKDDLAKEGVELSFSPLFSNDYIDSINIGRRDFGEVVGGYLNRARTLATSARSADALWVQYETFPYLPGFFERFVGLLQKPIVFDYDDATFHMYDTSKSRLVRSLLGSKLEPLIAASAAVTAGNEYLADYAMRWNDRVMVIPTVVDTDRVKPSRKKKGPVPVIGWLGTPSTWPYVRPMLPLLRDLVSAGRARFLAIGSGHASEEDRGGRIEFRDWVEQREVSDLQEMDIGIMPVPDMPWERGKCGFKLAQYMAVGIPSVASPVGVNAAMLETNSSGFLASDEFEWSQSLDRLLGDSSLRKSMGEAARVAAVAHYSLKSQAPRLVELFKSLDSRTGKRAH